MNRAEKIAAVQCRLRSYFDRGYDENKAYRALQQDSVLGPVRLPKIKLTFKRFQAEVEKEKRKQKVGKPNKRFRRNASRLLFFNEKLHCDHNLHPCARLSYDNNWNGRFSFYLEIPFINGSGGLRVFDWFNDTSAKITFEASAGRLKYLFPLNDYFGLALEEAASAPHVYKISFVELEIYKKELQTIQTVTRELFYPCICSDVANPANFVLRWYSADAQFICLQSCSFDESRILFGNIVQVENSNNKAFYSYFSGRHYWLQFGHEVDEQNRQKLKNASILIHNAETDENTNIPLRPLPRHVFYDNKEETSVGIWVRDRVFLPIRFKSSKDYGIVFTDPTRKDWTVMDICFELPIVGLDFSNGRDLIIYVQDTTVSMCNHNIRREIYKVPLKKPDTLRSMAWLTLVRKMKKTNHNHPYKEALKWLPFNSDLRFPV